MISLKILPKFFKDLIQHIPTIALKSVDWRNVLTQMGPLLLRMGSGQLEQNKINSLQRLEISGLSFEKTQSTTKLNPKKQGHILLEIYFSQLKNPIGLNLDLRQQHFNFYNDKLFWQPNNSWFQFDEIFRMGLIDLYKGFYHEDQELFRNALESLGLTANLSEEKVKKLQQIFVQHFGPGEQKVVVFELKKFSESFYEIFHFLLNEQVKLKNDFIFLGFYLVTLYMHLESLGESYDVRSAFLRAFPMEGHLND